MMFRLLLILCLGHCLPAVLGTDSGIDCDVGDTVMLPCDGPAATDTKEVHVMWVFEGKPAGWFEDGSWCETGRYVNRTRLGSIRQKNFSLVVNHVKEEDDGVYECRIIGKKNRRIRLFVKGDGKRRDAETPPRGSDRVCRPYREREDPPESKTKDKQDSDENPPGASSGGNSVVIGVIMGILVAVAAAVGACLWRKNQPRTRRPADPIQSAEYSLIDMNIGDSVNQRTEEPANERLADTTVCCSWCSPTAADNGGHSDELNMPP